MHIVLFFKLGRTYTVNAKPIRSLAIMFRPSIRIEQQGQMHVINENM